MTDPELRLTPYSIALAIVTVLTILSTAPQVTQQIQQLSALLATIGAALLTILFVAAGVNKALQVRLFTKSPDKKE